MTLSRIVRKRNGKSHYERKRRNLTYICKKKAYHHSKCIPPPSTPLLRIKNWNTIKELFDQEAVKRNSFQWMILVQINYLKLGSYFYVSVFWFLLKNILTNTEKIHFKIFQRNEKSRILNILTILVTFWNFLKHPKSSMKMQVTPNLH